MLTAILADDEPMILRGLEKLIDWNKLGVTIVGMASDGVEAKELIDTHKPNFVVSDINMPGLTGIDLLKYLNEKDSETKLIFLSGYQEFSYAQDAIKYGAVDYLIKPVNEKQLIGAIKKIGEEVARKANKPITLEVHLEEDGSTNEIDEEITITQKHFIDQEGYYSAICCHIDGVHTLNAEELELTQFSIMNIIEDLVETIEGHWIFNKNDSTYILVYKESEIEVKEILETLPRKIIDQIVEATGQTVSVSTSDIVEDINAIRMAFQVANNRMKQCYFYGEASVLNFNEQHMKKYNLEDYFKAQVAMLESILTYDRKKIMKAVAYYMETVKDISLWDKSAARNYCMASLVFIQQHLSDDVMAIKSRDFDQIKEAFDGTSNYQQAVGMMTGVCESYLKEIITSASNNQSSEIIKVKAYIQEHYAEPIRLETLAELVFMNPNYFSGYFKKHVGMKFKEYITNYRINEAEKLMLSSNYKVYEIAAAVGFGDYRHFSEVFKKIKGQSPSEYRKKIMNV